MKKIGCNHIRSENKEGVLEKDLEKIFAPLPGEPDPDFRDVVRIHIKPESLYVPNLELPRCMPGNLDHSQSLVLVFETREHARIFIFDVADGSLYHVHDKRAPKFQYPFSGFNGYAAIGGKLHFFPGCFTRPLVENRHVECLNLRTKQWEPVSKLNGPKPIPTVFVYGNKIYVIGGIDHYLDPAADPDYSAWFECMDPHELTWTKLPIPLFSRWSCTPHILDTVKGILLVAVQTFNEDFEDQIELHQFDFRSKTWSLHSLLNTFHFRDRLPFSDIFPLSPSYVGVSATLFAGCTVGNFLFYLDMDSGPVFCLDRYRPLLPEIVVYRKRVDHDHVVDSRVPLSDYYVVDSRVPLSDHLKWFTDHFNLSFGYLNHLGGLKFCLSIAGMTLTEPYSTGAGIMIFELQETGSGSATQIEATAHKDNFSFLRSNRCRMFQIPLQSELNLTFCKKM